jgi:LysR family glycine cleavage system transcriptional activator
MDFLLALERCRSASFFLPCRGVGHFQEIGEHEKISWLEDGMARRIPPLNPLHAFEASARLGSFTNAAKELGVTQSAVSRQISVMEGYARQRLFRRDRHGITLTPAGDTYLRDIAPAFARIAAATERLLQAGTAEPLRLRCYSTFAVKWLIPRLPRFREDHPGIEVRLTTGVAPVDFTREEVDLAIPFGDGNWPGLHSQLLLPDVIQPVCSPRLLRGRKALRTLDDLRQHPMLHARYRRDDWKDWLTAVGRPDLLVPGMEFPSSLLTYQAATEGLGVAMGQVRLLAHDFKAGALVALFDALIERPMGHFAVWPRSPDRKVRAFLDWLAREIRAA